MGFIDNTPIIKQIEEYINSEGSGFAAWYCGITDDIERRLRGEHQVAEQDPWWIARMAANKKAAELIEKYFHDQGCQGDQGGGNENSKYVYAYLIRKSTKE